MRRLVRWRPGSRPVAGLAGPVVVTVAAALVASCTASSRPTPPHQVTVALTGSLTQIRPDEGTRRLRTAVTNEGTSTLTVTAASLHWQGFAPVPAKIPQGTLAPGETAGFVLMYGDPRCATKPAAPPRLDVEVDGTRRTVPLLVHDPGLLRRLYHRECGLQRLNRTASVALRLGTHTVMLSGEEYLPGDVVVQRRSGSDAVRLVDLGGTVLLTLTPRRGPGAVPARMPPGRDSLRLPVLIGSAHRCDAHARGQASQPFLFAVYVGLDHQPTQRVITVPTKDQQAILLRLLDRDCG